MRLPLGFFSSVWKNDPFRLLHSSLTALNVALTLFWETKIDCSWNPSILCMNCEDLLMCFHEFIWTAVRSFFLELFLRCKVSAVILLKHLKLLSGLFLSSWMLLVSRVTFVTLSPCQPGVWNQVTLPSVPQSENLATEEQRQKKGLMDLKRLPHPEV